MDNLKLPADIFELDDPDRSAAPQLRLKSPWKFGGSSELTDPGIIAAQEAAAAAWAAAQDAQVTADGKIESFWQPEAPTNAAEGDIWFDTNDGNKVYRWSGTAWVASQDSGIAQALEAAATAQGTADAKARIYYQAAQPTELGAADQGDLWCDTDSNYELYAWTGSAWQLAQDWYAANQAAATAQSAATQARTRVLSNLAVVGAYVGEVAIYASQLYSWSGSGLVLEDAVLPSTEGLVGYWSMDEFPNKPEIPDDPAGTTYLQDAWATTDGWVATRCTITASGGKLLITATDINPTISKDVGLASKTAKVKSRKLSSAATQSTLRATGTPDYYNGKTYETTEHVHSASFASDAPVQLSIYPGGINVGAVAGDTFEIDWVYVGDGAYLGAYSDIPDDPSGANYLKARPDWIAATFSLNTGSTISIVDGKWRGTRDATSGLIDAYKVSVSAWAGRLWKVKFNCSQAMEIQLCDNYAGSMAELTRFQAQAGENLVEVFVRVGTTTVWFRTAVAVPAGAWFEFVAMYVGNGYYLRPLLDNSGNGNHGKLSLMAPTDGMAGKALAFYGKRGAAPTSYLRPTLTEFTVSAWIFRTTAYDTGSDEEVISDHWYYDSTHSSGIQFGKQYGSANFGFTVYQGQSYVATACASSSASSAALTLNAWHHVCGTFKGGEAARLYFDGVLVSSDTTSVPPFCASNNHVSFPLCIGNRAWSNQYSWDGLIDEARFYERALSAEEVRGLYLAKSGPKLFTKADWLNEQAASDGVIAPQEKPALYSRWDEASGAYTQAVADATAASVPTSALTTKRDALYAYLFTTPGCLASATWEIPVAIDKATFAARWSEFRAAESAIYSAIATKRASDATGQIQTLAPKYLGRYGGAHPSTYNPGDSWTVYDTDDSPIQRGVWYSNNGTPTRISAKSGDVGYTTDQKLLGKLVEALTDVAWAEANGYGASGSYGIETLFQSLAAVTAFIQSLFAREITLLAQGFLQSYNYAETGGVPTTGFKLDVANQVIKAANARFRDCVVDGRMELRALSAGDNYNLILQSFGNGAAVTYNVSEGDCLVAPANGVAYNGYSSDYRTMYAFEAPFSGTVRIRVAYGPYASGDTAYLRIIVNGSAVYNHSTNTVLYRGGIGGSYYWDYCTLISYDVTVISGQTIVIASKNSVERTGTPCGVVLVGLKASVAEEPGIARYLCQGGLSSAGYSPTPK